MDQNAKRELIKKIKADETLTEKEKSIKIQQIFSSNFVNQIQSQSNVSSTCSHYIKQCSKFKFACCNTIDPCKRCHLERGNCNPTDIKITHITCNLCGLEQEPSPQCSNSACGVEFAPSYCGICQIWTPKQIYHCVDCGLCRVGTAQTLYHCVDCGICINKSTTSDFTHQCIGVGVGMGRKITNQNERLCVVCSESTFNSQSPSINLPCSHFIHQSCYNQCLQQFNYKCPHCKKSICNLRTHWNFIRSQIKLYPIPNEMIPIEPEDIVDTPYGKFKVNKINIIEGTKLFEGEFVDWFTDKNSKYNVSAILNYSVVKKNLYKSIYCNDCGKNSQTPFHFYGLECKECGSFNTQE